MTSAISIDRAGRLVIPQHVRRQFHLAAGDVLDLDVVPEGIILRVHSRQAALVEENGLLVHEGDAIGDLAKAVDRTRSDRDAEVLGLRR